jgi:hypothetical protein
MPYLRPLSELTETYTITPSGRTNAPYFLTGKRGAVYMLMRNVHTPDALFPISTRGHLPNNLRDQWFTDRDYHVEG